MKHNPAAPTGPSLPLNECDPCNKVRCIALFGCREHNFRGPLVFNTCVYDSYALSCKKSES